MHDHQFHSTANSTSVEMFSFQKKVSPKTPIKEVVLQQDKKPQGEVQKSKLVVLLAAYGTKNVTDLLNLKIKNDALSVRAETALLGNSPLPTSKYLSVIYQYENCEPCIAFAREGSTLSITKGANNSTPLLKLKHYKKINVLKACYATMDVSKHVETFIASELQKAEENKSIITSIRFPATNMFFNHDPLPGIVKTCLIVYTIGSSTSLCTSLVREGLMCPIRLIEQSPLAANSLSSFQQLNYPLKIWAAVYGPVNCSAVVQDQCVNKEENELHMFADNATLTDTFPNVRKTFHLYYQYGNQALKTCIAEETEAVDVTMEKDSAPEAEPLFAVKHPRNCLIIHAAAYGKASVKHIVEREVHVKNNYTFTANNALFGSNTFPMQWKKTYSILYSIAPDYRDKKLICGKEGDVILLPDKKPEKKIEQWSMNKYVTYCDVIITSINMEYFE